MLIISNSFACTFPNPPLIEPSCMIIAFLPIFSFKPSFTMESISSFDVFSANASYAETTNPFPLGSVLK